MAFIREAFNQRFPEPPQVTRAMPGPEIEGILVSRTARYEDLVGVDVHDNNEPLVTVPTIPGLTYFQRSSGIYEATGLHVFLREGIVDKLAAAGKDLNRAFPGYKFGILEGYRPLKQQEKEFEEAKVTIRDSGKYENEMDLNNQAHLRSAAPDVGGHVAGAAFDFMIVNPDGVPVNMGTAMSEWIPQSWLHHPDISAEGRFARETAANILAKQGIQIFEGEFWHGHFGDREYAWLNNVPAIYDKVDFTVTDKYSDLSPRGRRFAEYIASTFGQPMQVSDHTETIMIQRVHQPAELSPAMTKPNRHT